MQFNFFSRDYEYIWNLWGKESVFYWIRPTAPSGALTVTLLSHSAPITPTFKFFSRLWVVVSPQHRRGSFPTVSWLRCHSSGKAETVVSPKVWSVHLQVCQDHWFNTVLNIKLIRDDKKLSMVTSALLVSANRQHAYCSGSIHSSFINASIPTLIFPAAQMCLGWCWSKHSSGERQGTTWTGL